MARIEDIINPILSVVRTFGGVTTLKEFKQLRLKSFRSLSSMPTWTRLVRSCVKNHKVFWRRRREFSTAGRRVGFPSFRRYHTINGGCFPVLRTLRSRGPILFGYQMRPESRKPLWRTRNGKTEYGRR
jgi:hypothetical protein